MKRWLWLLPFLAVLALHAPARVPYYGSPGWTPDWYGTGHRVGLKGLVDQSGQPFELSGRPTVVRFFFTRCGSVCPGLTRNLRGLDPEVPVVSISVTPEDDTPDSLRDYARREGLPPTWRLLTGSPAEIHRLARAELFCGADDFRTTATGREVLHSEKVFLLDGRGRLRGLYNGSLPLEVEHLQADLKLLTGCPK